MRKNLYLCTPKRKNTKRTEQKYFSVYLIVSFIDAGRIEKKNNKNLLGWP